MKTKLTEITMQIQNDFKPPIQEIVKKLTELNM